MRLRYNDSH